MFRHYLICPSVRNHVRTDSETSSASLRVCSAVGKVAVPWSEIVSTWGEECLGVYFHAYLWCN